MYCSLHGDNTSHNSKDCNILKSKGSNKPKLYNKDFNKKTREFNITKKKASQEKSKYLKYKSLNKASSQKKNLVILEDSESDPSSIEEQNSSDEGE